LDPLVWQRVRSIFERSIELSPELRGAFLDGACGGDATVRREVEIMLAADAAARAADDAVAAVAPDLLQALVSGERARERDEWAGQRLGAWRLLREIGRGGMGAVYLAERDDGEYQQQAAVKLMRPTWDSAELLQRFRSERQILASLSHPNIARLLDGGVSADGKPYLVLEFVVGASIDAYCDNHHLDLTQRLGLFLSVCAAVEYAHRSLVVHRDLKPSNILVNSEGQVKLLDFGIAKLIHTDGGQSASTARLFTPEYAAPEQLRGEAVTTGVDVYALGLLLYQLLTGRRPYGSTASTPAAYEQAILTQEPQSPSRVAAQTDAENHQAAQARQLDPASLSARLRGDLDAIVLRALRKEPAQRYASVEAMAADVQSYLAHRPVAARRGNRRYRAGRFLQRHALSTALAGAVLLALIGGLALALWQADQVRQQRDLVSAQASRAEQLSGFLVGVFSHADPRQRAGEAVSAKALLDAAVVRIRTELGGEPLTRMALMRSMTQAYMGLGLPPEALALSQELVTLGRSLGSYPEWGLDLTLLGVNLNDTSQPTLAEPIALEALEWTEAQPDPDLRLIARILNLQGAITLQLPDSEARTDAIYGRLLGMLEADPALEPSRLEAVRLMVSRRLASKGEFAAAEKLVNAVIADIRRAAPSRDLDLPGALGALGNLYMKMGRHTEQIATYRESLPLTQRLLGPEHWQVGIVSHNLANALESVGQDPEALEHSENAVRIGIATVGAEHNFTTVARVLRARLHCKLSGAAGADPTEHAELVKLADKYPAYRERLEQARALCGLPALAP